jgi:hypothetical protein
MKYRPRVAAVHISFEIKLTARFPSVQVSRETLKA